MSKSRRKIGEVLIELGLIDQFQLRSALAHQERWGKKLGEILVDLDFINEGDLMKGLGKHLNVPAIDPRQLPIAKEVLRKIEADIAEKFQAIPVAIKTIDKRQRLVLAMADPSDLKAIEELQFLCGMSIYPVVGTITAVRQAIRHNYFGEEFSEVELDAQLKESGRFAATAEPTSDTSVDSGATALADALVDHHILSAEDRQLIVKHQHPVAILTRLLFDKKIIGRGELIKILEVLKLESRSKF